MEGDSQSHAEPSQVSTLTIGRGGRPASDPRGLELNGSDSRLLYLALPKTVFRTEEMLRRSPSFIISSIDVDTNEA